MNIEQNVIEKLRQLPLEKQQELLDFAEFLSQKNIPKPNLQSVKGLCADLKVDITKEDIDQIRLDFMDSLANKYQVSQAEKSLKDLLQEMPDLGEDADFIHVRDSARQISL